MSGEIINISGRTLTILEDGIKVKYAIAKDATIRINGERSRLGQLEPGDDVTLSGKEVMGFKNVEIKRDPAKIQKVAKERTKVVQELQTEANEEKAKAQAGKTSQEDRMVEAAKTRGDESKEDDYDNKEEEPEDLESLTVAELKDLAQEEDILLHGATSKADIIKAIKKARK